MSTATRTVVVVSFWPGNNAASGVGGFNWRPDDPNVKDWVRTEVEWHLGNVWTERDHVSFAVQRFRVPVNLTDEQVTDWLGDQDTSHAWFETNRQEDHR